MTDLLSPSPYAYLDDLPPAERQAEIAHLQHQRREEWCDDARRARDYQAELAETKSDLDDTRSILSDHLDTGATPRPTERFDWWSVSVLERRAKRKAEKDRDAAVKLRDAAFDSRDAALSRIAELEAALEPFAKTAWLCDDPPGVKTCDNVELWQTPNARWSATYGDLRRARAALRK